VHKGKNKGRAEGRQTRPKLYTSLYTLNGNDESAMNLSW
jgi:hypothetical protein